MSPSTSVSRGAARPNVRAGAGPNGESSQAPRDSTTDLLAVLADVQAIAEKAKRIQLDIAAGYAVNGMTGLRQIELAARDVLAHHKTPNGGHR